MSSDYSLGLRSKSVVKRGLQYLAYKTSLLTRKSPRLKQLDSISLYGGCMQLSYTVLDLYKVNMAIAIKHYTNSIRNSPNIYHLTVKGARGVLPSKLIVPVDPDPLPLVAL